MPRLTQLSDVLFPVDEHPVFVEIKTPSGGRRLTVPDKKAIVNCDTGRVLGVVGRGYRLVTNQEAMEAAFDCCRMVFPETKPAEWKAEAVDGPSMAGYCFIDLHHSSAALDFEFVPAKDRPDTFGPFIRVTNSYNGFRALAFDIGFSRKVCKNGLILPKSVIQFKFSHSRSQIGATIQFDIAHDKLAKLRVSFGEYLGALRECRVDRAQLEPLVCAVLGVRKPKSAKDGTPELADWGELLQHLSAMCNRYVTELGENAYAALNVITEFASRPPDNRCLFRERHSLQRRAGTWVSDFSRICREPEFALDDYIDKAGKNENFGEASAPVYRRRA